MPDKIEGRTHSLWEREYLDQPRLLDENEWRPVCPKEQGLGFIMVNAGPFDTAFQLSKRNALSESRRHLKIGPYLDPLQYGYSTIDISSPQPTSENDLVGTYLSKRHEYFTTLLQRWPGNELDEIHLFAPSSYLTDFLAQHHDDSDEKLGEIVDALLDYNKPHELRNWLSQNLEHWLAQRVVALAAVIEAAVRFSPPVLDHELVYRVLSYKHPHPLVVSVLTQRVRLLHIEKSKLRGKIWKALKAWIDIWSQDSIMQEHAVMALPSVPYVAGREAVSWLSQLIGGGPERIAWGAALAVLDWASGNCTETESLDEESGRVLSEAILTRLREEPTKSSDNAGALTELVPTLIWVLGATATTTQLPQVARVLADAFDRANGIEDAAAIRAGKMLVRQLRDEASKALIDAFGAESTLFVRFWTAMAV